MSMKIRQPRKPRQALRMRQGIASVLLLCLLACLVPASGFAAPPPGMRISGVDYARIEENIRMRLPVTVTVGNRTFTCRLENGNQLGNEKVDALIKQVMKEMEMTEGTLLYSEDVINKAAKTEGFKAEVLLELGLKLTGADTVMDIYDVATGKKKADDALASFIIGQTVSTICEKLLGGIAGAVVSGLYNSTDVLLREQARLIEESRIKQAALEQAFLLGLFYDRCNQMIEQQEKKQGTDQWKIVGEHTLWTKTTIFGVGTMQYWKLKCDLTRTFDYGGGDVTDYSGVYRGKMQLELWHDLSELDAQFLNTVYLGPHMPFSILEGYYNIEDRYTMQSSLEKTLTQEDFEIHIDRANGVSGVIEEPFSLGGFTDQTLFALYHPIFCWGKPSIWDENGEFEFSGSGVYVRDELSLSFNFAGKPENNNMSCVLMVDRWQVTDNVQVRAPYKSYSHDGGDGGGGVTVLTDHDVFRDLRKGEGVMIVRGR